MTDHDGAALANFGADDRVLGVRYLDGSASSEEVDGLCVRLAADPALRERFATLCVIVTSLDELAALPSMQGEDGESLRTEVPQSASNSRFPALFTNTIEGTVGYFSSGWPVAYLVATVIIGLGLLIGAFVRVSPPLQFARQTVPSPSTLAPMPSSTMEFVGRITGMLDCRWADPATEAISGAHVPLGRKYALESGLIEITYDSGARVILQGPVTYDVESKSGGYLSVGKLTARLEKKADYPLPTTHHPLFTIRTPTAVVTDLGTEFGVEVHKDGYTASLVFRGSVKVQLSGTNAAQAEKTIVLRENESFCTEKGDAASGPGVVMRRDGVNPQAFVRRISTPAKILDLLDVVAGGNGFGRHRERGIDPGTGRENAMFLAEGHDSDREYRPVTLQELIDGVFIPDGGSTPMALDSAGHTFDGFPRTSGKSYGLIWARAADVNAAANGSQLWVYGLGRGEQFMPQHRGLLCMHANAGITFNLETMRKLYSSGRPARFRALAGVAMATPDATSHTANFNSDIEGWNGEGDGPYWGSTGGQDGGGYAGAKRDDACPYLTPPVNSILYGDLASNFGNPVLSFSYYLKNLGGSPSDGGRLYMFADCDGDGLWDTIWQWEPGEMSVPHEWRQYTWTVDTAANALPAGWTRASGSGGWVDSWKHVKYWNFWSGRGSGQIDNGIDTVVVSGVADGSAASGREQLADVWVFVDGQLKLKRERLCPKDGVIQIDVELSRNDRFLTLVSTDGGNGNWRDWVVFGDPVLDLVPIEREE
jgi:hypothetical protein